MTALAESGTASRGPSLRGALGHDVAAVGDLHIIISWRPDQDYILRHLLPVDGSTELRDDGHEELLVSRRGWLILLRHVESVGRIAICSRYDSVSRQLFCVVAAQW